ncbi:DUF4438 domain-containing protein [Salinibacterium sp. SWN1162]|uniref:DUF4438 family protein n=1 Tax=Salinibacterium sp. SWN1162 TaxID=2792053 RepID=UPI0018CE8859|nr:DUF4438 domain-containing protein [Salinibacterium sp. SWN1162]MBH0008690.1 DUF4438 domain-containing protein [Salinibacterium sp. SWN1162]
MKKAISNNLLGFVEHASLTPMVSYRVDRDGHPYVPIGDGGIVLGVHLGDSVFATDTDHAAAGVTLVHPDPGARLGLTSFACIGNRASVRSGAATGATGFVVAKRGEAGRVIVAFDDGVMAALLPGDQVVVHAVGQGSRPESLHADIAMLNLSPGLFDRLPKIVVDGVTVFDVVGELPSKVCGNGIGRPAHQWDVDLAVVKTSSELGESGMRLGDLFVIRDLDVRHNMGYRRSWVTLGAIGHGGSPLPGHGPGFVPLLSGPAAALNFRLWGGTTSGDGIARPAITTAMLEASGS